MSIMDKFEEQVSPAREKAARNYWHHVPKDKRQPLYDAMVAEVTAVVETERLDVPPFNDDLSKDEMVQHLLEFHAPLPGRHLSVASHMVSGNGTKATKEDLRRWHDQQHENDNVVRFEMKTQWDGSLHVPTVQIAGVPHQHSAIVLNEEQSKVLAAVRNNQKAANTTLGARDQKVLKELVDNDFGSLKAEMKAFAADSLSAQIADLNAEWDEKEKALPDYAGQATTLYRAQQAEYAALHAKVQQQLRDLKQKHEDAFTRVTDKAKEKGVVLKKGSATEVNPVTQAREERVVYTAEVEGRKEAVAAAQAENKKMVDRALLTVEKQRLTAQRQVLLSSVPDAALPIVESIPDAKTLMVEAQMVPAKEIESTNQS